MRDFKFSHSSGGASHKTSADGWTVRHDVENETGGSWSGSMLIVSVVIAVFVAIAIGYGYETVNAPSPLKPVAVVSQNSAMPHSVATTPEAPADAMAAAPPPVVISSANVHKTVAVLPRPSPEP